MKKRADQLLVDKGLAPSRVKAKELIEAGEVTANGDQVKKASQEYSIQNTVFGIQNSNLLKFVSRAGLKLESVLNEFNIQPKDKNCLDLGASTGGFTDCLLQYGASHVDAVDVGHDQLHEKLRVDDRVTCIEGQDVRGFQGGPYDIIVADLSFISLTKVLRDIRSLASPGTMLALLIKPQFEVGSDNIDKKGIVKSDKAIQDALENIQTVMIDHDFTKLKLTASGLAGRDGNQEYFIYAEVSGEK